MPKSKFFRIAVEGGTTDGRTIERGWLEEMAAGYDPATYSARINMEHIRGYSPEAPFNAYGDVLSLETREIDLNVGGETEKRLALYAQVDATDELVALNKKRQKLFTSCEIAPNFAGKGKAYLVGLAVTDSPASLGCEMLAFAAGAGEANPLANRKQANDNLFTAADELELELEPADPAVGELRGLVATFAALVQRFTKSTEGGEDPASDPAPTPPPANDDDDAANDNVDLSSIVAPLTALSTALEAQATRDAERDQAVAALTSQVAELSTKLDNTPAGTRERPLATGTTGNFRTDC